MSPSVRGSTEAASLHRSNRQGLATQQKRRRCCWCLIAGTASIVLPPGTIRKGPVGRFRALAPCSPWEVLLDQRHCQTLGRPTFMGKPRGPAPSCGARFHGAFRAENPFRGARAAIRSRFIRADLGAVRKRVQGKAGQRCNQAPGRRLGRCGGGTVELGRPRAGHAGNGSTSWNGRPIGKWRERPPLPGRLKAAQPLRPKGASWSGDGGEIGPELFGRLPSQIPQRKPLRTAPAARMLRVHEPRTEGGSLRAKWGPGKTGPPRRGFIPSGEIPRKIISCWRKKRDASKHRHGVGAPARRPAE